MGLFDRLTGTKYPQSEVPSLPSTELRAALLALNGPDVPWVVRHATAKEGGDLVAEWRVPELRLRLRTRMLLVPADREVRALQERWEARSGERSYGRGPATTVSRQWRYERGEDGRRHKVETFRFDSRQMRDPLRDTVLGAGWTWRGRLFRM
ncbi:hypothetical protein [Streptomyces sp. NPDC005209]|uniref:hypothetical protein n=1 Tax=Streptomyces sp. NPDC005209 TaxID=3156715 RepID=UPI0033B730A0